ncbi:hypothetical protein EYF80_001555 [Liparis tanakae]|uniref:Uncharacterized protein n=1 Tax=Liparis tanakae TaxID=230148 RepID=A0A4Z2JDP4_9TELE|nr:hypothetical protein EYF80_001555 [Liparis tanakae]
MFCWSWLAWLPAERVGNSYSRRDVETAGWKRWRRKTVGLHTVANCGEGALASCLDTEQENVERAACGSGGMDAYARAWLVDKETNSCCRAVGRWRKKRLALAWACGCQAPPETEDWDTPVPSAMSQTLAGSFITWECIGNKKCRHCQVAMVGGYVVSLWSGAGQQCRHQKATEVCDGIFIDSKVVFFKQGHVDCLWTPRALREIKRVTGKLTATSLAPCWSPRERKRSLTAQEHIPPQHRGDKAI